MREEQVIEKVWRSELKLVAAFLFFSVISVVIAHKFPGNRLLFPTAPLFTIGETTWYLRLPLVWFAPFLTLSLAAFRIYDVRYSLDSQGIEMKKGILSFKQSITRVRYEDIRSTKIEQTLLDRMVDTGCVEVSTAASGDTEIFLMGVGAPIEVKKVIEMERTARQKAAREKAMRMYDESANV
jgi:uncharacterized membrane protein YdbT with pleckstrin-like domain